MILGSRCSFALSRHLRPQSSMESSETLKEFHGFELRRSGGLEQGAVLQRAEAWQVRILGHSGQVGGLGAEWPTTLSSTDVNTSSDASRLWCSGEPVRINFSKNKPKSQAGHFEVQRMSLGHWSRPSLPAVAPRSAVASPTNVGRPPAGRSGSTRASTQMVSRVESAVLLYSFCMLQYSTGLTQMW